MTDETLNTLKNWLFTCAGGMDNIFSYRMRLELMF